MDLLGLVTQQLTNQKTLNQIGKNAGVDASQAQQVLQLGLPAILQGLTKNAGNPQGAASLSKALSQHQNDQVDDVSGFLKKVDTDDGAKILQHVFGSRNQSVQTGIAKQTGMETSQVSGLMNQLAPLLLGALGRQSTEKRKGASDISGLASLLSQATSQFGGSNPLGSVSKLLDADGDGYVMDDIGNMLGSFLKKPK